MKAEATRKNIEDLREWGHPALADRIEAEQIGRASCRERVSDYV